MFRLRDLRKEKNITMKQIGKIIGVSESAVSLYESGKRQPDYNTLQKLADFFNVSIDYLLGREEKVTFDDFTYAMYNETKELTDEDKEALLNMARILKKKVEENKNR